MLHLVKEKIRRQIVRFILSFTPVWNPNDSLDICISTLIGHEQSLYFMCSLTTFYLQTHMQLPVFIIDDGSLTTDDIFLLRHKYKATIVERKTCDLKMSKLFRSYSHLFRYRFDAYNLALKQKLDAFLLPATKRVLYIEYDLLFYKPPVQILNWIHRNDNKLLLMEHDRKLLQSYKREDIDYCLRRLLQYTFKEYVSFGYNSGLVGIPDRNFVNLSRLDKIFQLLNQIGYRRIEAALNISFDSQKYELLPGNQYVCPARFDEYAISKRLDPVLIHYIWETKEQFLSDALWLIIKSLYK